MKWFLLSGLSALQNTDLVDHHSQGDNDEDDEEDQTTNESFVIVCKMMVITGEYQCDGIYIYDTL